MVPGTQQVLNGWHVWPTTERLCFVQDPPCPSILCAPEAHMHLSQPTCASAWHPGPPQQPPQPQYTTCQKDRATALKGWA